MTEFTWARLGAGAVLAWLALPLLARATRAPTRSEPAGCAARLDDAEPASQHRRLVLVLLASASMFLVPWLAGLRPLENETAELASSFRGGLIRAKVEVARSVGLLPTSMPPRATDRLAIHFIQTHPLVVTALLWLALVAFGAARRVIAFQRLRRGQSANTPAPRELVVSLERCARAVGIKAPRLVLSTRARVPFVAFTLAPVIVLPEHLARSLTAEELELTFRHELAHLRRRDPLLHELVGTLSMLFFGHPSARKLLQDIAVYREAAVDAEVSRYAPHTYASLLLRVASQVPTTSTFEPIGMDAGSLSRRIALLTGGRPQRKLSARWVGVAALFFAIPGFAATQLVAGRPSQKVGFTAEHDRQVRACYAQALKQHPGLVVHAGLRYVLRGDKIVLAHIDVPQAPELADCIIAAVTTWSIPAMPAGPDGHPRQPIGFGTGMMAIDLGEAREAPAFALGNGAMPDFADNQRKFMALVEQGVARGLLDPEEPGVSEALKPPPQ